MNTMKIINHNKRNTDFHFYLRSFPYFGKLLFWFIILWKNPGNDSLGSCALIMVHFTTRFFELYLPVQLLSSNQILMMSIIYSPISHTFYDNCNHSISLLSQTIEKTKIYTKTANKQNRTNTTLRTKSLEYTT